MAEEKTPFTRECAWTGNEFEGKAYVLTTTDGQEIVSAAAFLAPWDNADKQAPADAPVDQAPADEQKPAA